MSNAAVEIRASVPAEEIEDYHVSSRVSNAEYQLQRAAGDALEEITPERVREIIEEFVSDREEV